MAYDAKTGKGLGRFYDANHRAFRFREWKGLKDTLYDYGRWMYLYCFMLDEPIGGVDPATRDYIIGTIIGNYDPQAAVIISTHLIADVENVLDDVIFINKGEIVLQSSVDDIRQKYGKSVDALFREEFRCWEN